jgi:hypothetical protein
MGLLAAPVVRLEGPLAHVRLSIIGSGGVAVVMVIVMVILMVIPRAASYPA